MKRLVLITFIALQSLTSCAQTEESSTVYYFIRHAEKDRSDKLNKDPKLIEKGIKRAKKWSEVLKNVRFDAIYSTNYERTKSTALPTALKNDLKLTLYNPSDMDYDLFKKETKGKTVLVVGHSNTTPVFVNKILNNEKYKFIEDSNNANLYVVSIINSITNDQLLYID